MAAQNPLPFLGVVRQDASADQHRAALRRDDEIGSVIVGDSRAIEPDQEPAALAAVRADHTGVADIPLPKVVDPAAGRPGRHLVHQEAARVAQICEGDNVGRGVVRREDWQLLLGRPINDQVAGLAPEWAEVRVAPLHDGDGGNKVNIGLHGALVVDLGTQTADGFVRRIAVGFELDRAGAGFLAAL